MLKDIDKIFEIFLRDYMKKNEGKFTEEEWEDKMGALYEEFGKKPLKELGGKSVEQYYGELSAEDLSELLKKHIEESVPVSDYLCDAITNKPESEKYLLRYIAKDTDEELFSYAVNMLEEMGSKKPFNSYMEMITDGEVESEVKELVTEILADHAEEVTDAALNAYKRADDSSKLNLLDILVKGRKNDATFEIIMSGLRENSDMIPQYCQYVASYGDDRALKDLYEIIERADINYADFMELKYAIETLGGEYEKERNFQNDKYFKKIKGNK